MLMCREMTKPNMVQLKATCVQNKQRDECNKGWICFFIHQHLEPFSFHPLVQSTSNKHLSVVSCIKSHVCSSCKYLQGLHYISELVLYKLTLSVNKSCCQRMNGQYESWGEFLSTKPWVCLNTLTFTVQSVKQRYKQSRQKVTTYPLLTK